VNFQSLNADQKILCYEYFDPFDQWKEEAPKIKLTFVVDLLAPP